MGMIRKTWGVFFGVLSIIGSLLILAMLAFLIMGTAVKDEQERAKEKPTGQITWPKGR